MTRQTVVPATVRDRISIPTIGAIFGGIWTIFALSVAITSTQRGTGLTVIWWAVFPAGWLLVHYRSISVEYRRIVLIGATLLGSVMVVVGAWMAWPWYSPLYEGGRVPTLGPIIAERGFQLFDLPLVATAVGGALGIIHYRNRTYEFLIAIGTGLSTFLVAVGIGWFVGDGLWVLSWGFYITLGGAIGMVYAGLFGLWSLNTE
jgi:hypothetical protein